MVKYDIRRATGSKNKKQPLQQQINQDTNKNSVDEQQKLVTPSPTNDDAFSKAINLFDTIVTHNYLSNLTTYPIVEFASLATSAMGWYKITRIVYDGETFFPNQLSMLFTALHDVACNVALIIDKKGLDDIEIYIGARDFEGNLHEASTLLGSSIQGYLPGIILDPVYEKEFCKANSDKFVASFSGMASLRDDKKELFIQGIEKFIDATPAIPSYTALFIADNVSQQQTSNIIRAYSSLHDVINPLVQCQESINESETKSVSDTLTKTLGETITETLSETVTRTEGTNQSYSNGHVRSRNFTENKSANIFRSAISCFFGGKTGTNDGETISDQANKNVGSHLDKSKANSFQQGKGTHKENSDAHTKAKSSTIGRSKTINRTNSLAKLYIDTLNRNTDRILSGIPYGLWSIGTYFISPDISTSRKLANIYRGCVTGEESDLDSTAVNVWEKNHSNTILKYLQDTQNPRFLVGNINVSCGEIVTSKELAIHMSLPQKSVPGVEVRECAAFGRNINSRKSSQKAKDVLNLGKIAHLGKITHKDVLLDVEELSKHVFVTGSTGSGKSNTVYLLVDEIIQKGKNVLIVEPTKGDYRKVFGGIEGFTVYSTRENEKNLLRINPFAFPDGIQVVEHVERLVDIFGVCWPMYAAMPAVLKNSILSAYRACGWDLKRSVCKYGILFPTIADVVIQLKKIISSSEYSADTKGDYVGALQTRLESLQNGIYASILSSDNIPYATLYDKNSIVDLHHIGSTETRALLMAMVFLGLNEWRIAQGEDLMDTPLKHVTVLEEAHNILPRVSKQQNQEGSNMLGKSVEMIADGLARMRTFGESFIIVDQSPSALDESAIRNTNTKIVMNLPDGEDRAIAGKSIALTKEEQVSEIAKLSTGEAIVWQRGWSEPILASIDEMKNKLPLFAPHNTISIKENEQLRLSCLFVDYFIKESIELTTASKDELWLEISISDCPSCVKAILFDKINGTKFNNPSIVRNAIISFTHIDGIMKDLIESYSSGSENLIFDLRDYMANNMGIIDTNTQNKLLSMAFIWASLQNNKWHSICSQCIPSNIVKISSN